MVYKTRITALDELKRRLRTERAKLDHVVVVTLWQPFVSGVVDAHAVFCTPSLAVFPTRCNQLYSDLANLEAIVEVG